MNANNITKFKWFWAWNDDKEEAWLSEMSREGLHLKKVSLGSYEFIQGEPTNYVYRMDYRSLKSKEKESYLQIFKDAGWEHIGDMNGWVYFRIKAKPGETPEIFSDAESKTGKYQRILMYLVIFLPVLFIIKPSDPDRYGFFSILAGLLFTVVLILYSLAMLRLMKRINEVKVKEWEINKRLKGRKK